MKRFSFLIVFLFSASCLLTAQSRYTPEKMMEMGRLSDEQVSPDGKWVLYGVSWYSLKENKSHRKLYVVPINGGEAKLIGESAFSQYNARWRPDGKKIGFLTAEAGGMQLWEVNADGTGRSQITKIEGGIDNFGYSSTGKYISFTRDVKVDSTLKDKYPDLPKANAMAYDDLMYRHWNEWSDENRSHIFYATYDEGKIGEPIDIMPDEKFDAPVKPFGGTEEISWSPDDKTIAYVCKKLVGKEYATTTNSDIFLYNIETKKTENLTENSLPGYANEPNFSSDGKKLAYVYMKRGGFESDKNDIIVYDLATKDRKSLTENFDASASHIKWDKKSQNIYFTVGLKATVQVGVVPVQTQELKVEGRTDQPRILTSGDHNYNSLSVTENELILSKTKFTQPQELFKYHLKNKKEIQLTSANKEVVDDFETGPVEKRIIKTTDGKDMLVWVLYPPDFDKGKKYPALLYCQGGPQITVNQFFSYRWNLELFAAQGYIVVAPNRRGLPSFGKEWNDEISGDWGGQPMEDYLSAIDEIAKEPFVDKENLGAIGASFGGYSVYYLAGNHNKRFKTFVAHCGNFNFESWYSETEELFFANWELKGPYWQEPKPISYNKFSPHLFVKNWDTPLLVIHGEKDFRIPVTHGMQAFNTAQMLNIPSRFLYFPEEGHWILGPQNQVLWYREVFEWLDKWLKK
jgi:dipeptidyl aminopeptidase/acylaminoacyl peptidase